MIRVATTADAAAVRAVYRPYVEETAISFEDDVPSVEEMARRIERSLAWLVCERDGQVAGYAYAGPFHARPAYRWSAEISVYVDAAHHRVGVGGELVDAVIDVLRETGHVNAFAGIALPNPGSEGLFSSRGFRPAARYERVGYKLGAWHDVAWLQLPLRDASVPPAELSTRGPETEGRS